MELLADTFLKAVALEVVFADEFFSTARILSALILIPAALRK